MKLINLLVVDLKRALFSLRFLLCVCGVSCMMFAAVLGLLGDSSSVWYLVDMSLGGSGMASMILCILPVFAFAISFAIEWEEKVINFWIVRTGVVRYAVSKVVVSAISGFLTVALGMLFFILILSLWFPLFTHGHMDVPYELLMEQGRTFLGMFFYITHFALSGALMAVCAMWISVYFPNRFVATAAPVVIHFTLLRITSRIDIPAYFNPTYWVEGIYSVGSSTTTLLIKLATVITLCCIMGIDTAVQMKRRISHA